MRKIVSIALLLLALAAPETLAQELLAYRDSVEQGYNFLLYVPEQYHETEAALPVVVFLHGKSLTGTDLNMVTRYGTIDALRRGLDLNAIVIAPQTSKVGWIEKNVMNTVDFVAQRYRVDLNRIYVFGMSMGGWGAFKSALNCFVRYSRVIVVLAEVPEEKMSSSPLYELPCLYRAVIV